MRNQGVGNYVNKNGKWTLKDRMVIFNLMHFITTSHIIMITGI